MIQFMLGDYLYKSLTWDELNQHRTPLIDLAFIDESSFDMQNLNPNTTALEALRARHGNFYELNLGVFYQDKMIAWSDGQQMSDNRYYMRNSAVLPQHRNQGIYSKLTDIVLEQTKQEGFLEIYSSHLATNNAILIAKMKKGFFITGMDLHPRFGTRINLTYSHSEELKMMYDFRAGYSLDERIATRYKNKML
jgi:GNAT superfamily N-acetyltransferase